MKEEDRIVSATESPEQVLSEILSEEKKAEFAERIRKIKETLDSVEARSINQRKDPMGPEEILQYLNLVSEISRNIGMSYSHIHYTEEEVKKELINKNTELLRKINEINDRVLNSILFLNA